MRTSKFKFFFIISIIIKFSNANEISIGSHCILKSGANGICQEWNNCEIIKDLWKKRAITRAHVTECNIFKKTICCPLSLDDETTTNIIPEYNEDRTTRRLVARTRKPTTTAIEPPTTEQIRVQNHSDRVQERISQTKCKEYAKSVMQITRLMSLIGQEPRETSTSKCSHKSVSLIVGRIECGTEANVEEFPHQALLGYSPRNTVVTWECGGSLVSPNFVMTAAHCLRDRKLGVVKKVKLGMRNIDDDHDGKKVFIFDIEKTFKHSNYNADTFNEDIALLKLNGVVPIGVHILPICLPTSQHDDFNAMATGFGRISKDGQQSDALLKVTLERFTHDECRGAYPEDGIVQIVEKTMLCYGHHTERKDTCRGDSGGPLQISNENNVHCTYTQIGISSFGPDRCGTKNFPSAYTNVFNYLDWIENIVWGDDQ